MTDFFDFDPDVDVGIDVVDAGDFGAAFDVDSPDINGNEMPDHIEGRFIDADHDTIPDVVSGAVDLDNDGLPDQHDDDLDNDGRPDGPHGPDMDGDGTGDFVDPSVDTDGDGLSDHAFTQHLARIRLFNPFYR